MIVNAIGHLFMDKTQCVSENTSDCSEIYYHYLVYNPLEIVTFTLVFKENNTLQMRLGTIG